MNNPPSHSVLTYLIGWATGLSFLTFGICAKSLRRYLNFEKLKNTGKLEKYINAPLPPREMLTENGQKLYDVAKIALVVSILGIVILILNGTIKA